MTDPNVDPLEGYEKTPSISFDPSRGGHAADEWFELEVRGYITVVDARNDDGSVKTYSDGNPVKKFVLPVAENGVEKGLWGTVLKSYSTTLFAQLRDAQNDLRKQTGNPTRRLGPGDVLAVRWYENTAVPKKLGNHPKAYEVKVKAGTTPPPTGADPLGEPVGAGASRSSDPWGSSSTSSVEPPFLGRTGFDIERGELTV